MNRSTVLKIWTASGLFYGAQLVGMPEFMWNKFFKSPVTEEGKYMTRFIGLVMLGYTATSGVIAEFGNAAVQDLAAKTGIVYMGSLLFMLYSTEAC